MPPSASFQVRLVQRIDRFTDRTGLAVALLNLPLVVVVAYEVLMRYAMDAPSTWAFELTYQLYAAVFMLGAAYALHKGAHIRTDFFFEKWSVRTKGLIDAVAYLVFFFPSFLVFFVVSAQEAWHAFDIGERSEQTPWRPLLWPFKAIVPVTCLLLLVQGISEAIKSVHAARTGVELEHKEKVEV